MVGEVEPVSLAAVPPLTPRRDDVHEIELHLLLDALMRFGDYDFRHYNQSVLRRKIAERMRAEGVETISGLQERLLHDECALARFLVLMCGSSPRLFHEPRFFTAFTSSVIPLLRTYSFVRIWLPGVGTGADAYALAAVLEEERLYDKAIIYATSISDVGTAVAKAGVYEYPSTSEFRTLARAAGITTPIEEYFDVNATAVVPNARLRRNVMFARHDPIQDRSINEFHTIVARNVFPMFNGAAQYQLHRLIFESLGRLGFLCLGSNETLAGTVHEHAFRRVDPHQAIFRRMR
jgi:chemotaxis protein methyltransferase CheR